MGKIETWEVNDNNIVLPRFKTEKRECEHLKGNFTTVDQLLSGNEAGHGKRKNTINISDFGKNMILKAKELSTK